jgi:predicted dehydrogenase
MEGEGTHHALMKFENGAVAHLVASWGLKYRDTPARLHLHTTKGCFVMTTETLEVITEEGRKMLYEPDEPTNPKHAAFREIAHFLSCVKSGDRPAVDGYEGMKSLRIIRVIESQRGAPVKLD